MLARESDPLRPGSVELLGMGELGPPTLEHQPRDPKGEAFRSPHPFPFPNPCHSLCVPTPSPGGSVHPPSQGAHWL